MTVPWGTKIPDQVGDDDKKFIDILETKREVGVPQLKCGTICSIFHKNRTKFCLGICFLALFKAYFQR